MATPTHPCTTNQELLAALQAQHPSLTREEAAAYLLEAGGPDMRLEPTPAAKRAALEALGIRMAPPSGKGFMIPTGIRPPGRR